MSSGFLSKQQIQEDRNAGLLSYSALGVGFIVGMKMLVESASI